MNDETKSAIRVAMLQAQSDWLERGEVDMKEQNFTGFAIAKVIATAFETEAAKYKTPDPERVGINADAYDKFASGDQS